MQFHRIRLNHALSGATVFAGNGMTRFGSYLTYGDSLGGGVVNSFNVRQFLNDPNNKVIADDFKEYLRTYTSEEELAQIVGSNQKLSDIFNEFYETTVTQAMPTPPSIIGVSLTNTVTTQHNEIDHIWNGTAPTSGLQNIPLPLINSDRSTDNSDASVQISTEDSYYIPVFISNSYQQNSKAKYDGCPTVLHQLLNPEAFVEPETTIEGESGRIDGSVTIINGGQNELNVQNFLERADELIALCYGSDCIDNRYCDFLRNGKTIMEISGPDEIQSAMNGKAKGYSQSDVLNAIVLTLSENGYPVVKHIYDCILGGNNTSGTLISTPNNGPK